MIAMQISLREQPGDIIDIQVSADSFKATPAEIEAYDMIYAVLADFLDEEQEKVGSLVVLPGGKQERQDG